MNMLLAGLPPRPVLVLVAPSCFTVLEFWRFHGIREVDFKIRDQFQSCGVTSHLKTMSMYSMCYYRTYPTSSSSATKETKL